MHTHNLEQWEHDHIFEIDDGRGEQRTKLVVLLTLITMIVEISAGYIYGSMALLADGWHMGTHTAALGISVFAYVYARKHADDKRFSFGTGKVGALGGFGSAVILAVVAVIMAVESVQRILSPTTILFNQAIIVAIVGLTVNLASAFILRGRHEHSHESRSAHDHHHDHNLRSAYVHVLADALTSLLAIAALLSGKYFGWILMDPLMGIVGAIVIIRWSYGLLRDSGNMLLDREIDQRTISDIKKTIEQEEDNRVSDIHVWRIGARHLSAIVSVVTDYPKPPVHYKTLLSDFQQLGHIVVEVNPCSGNEL
ncbi:CDF family Co(II)/Ni(II) efflux transporter DmeF [Thermodesulfobacteriota bacterium]